MNKMASGSEDIWPRSIEKEDEHPENKDVTLLFFKKKTEVNALKWKIDELVIEFEECKWDAILLNEMWRHEQILGNMSQTHLHGSWKIRSQTRGWNHAERKGGDINECAITTTILVNRQHNKLMSVYFPHSKYADHHIEKMYKTIEKHMLNNQKYIPIIGGDFNAESWDLVKERNVRVLANTL